MGTAIDKRQLESVYYMTVQDITFANDEIGSVTAGRSATSVWAQNATVVFKGKLKHILTFALMAFDVAAVAVNEKFELVPERKFLNVQNLGATDIVAVVDLDPTEGEGIVTDDDMTFLANLTNNFRLGWNDQKNIVVELKADLTKTLYRGTVLEALAYALQITTAPIYTLYDIALMDVASGVTKGVDYITLTGSSGPVELEKAHITLANLILSASQA